MAAHAAFNGVFVDENILGVAHELERRHPGDVYYVGHPLVPEIPKATKDADLLDALGVNQQGWILISRDRRIWRNKVARQNWVDAHVRAVILSGTNSVSKTDAANLIDSHWQGIVNEVASQPGPALWSLTKPRGLRRIRPAA